MTFSSNQEVELTTKKKSKSARSDSATLIRFRSGGGSNQLEVLFIECPGEETQDEETHAIVVVAATTKAIRKKDVAVKRKPKEKAKKVKIYSPAMGIRSKVKIDTGSSMGTKSKRRLSL